MGHQKAQYLVDSLSKGSTINHLGWGRGADFRERNFFFRRPSEPNFNFFAKIERRNFFFNNMVLQEKRKKIFTKFMLSDYRKEFSLYIMFVATQFT